MKKVIILIIVAAVVVGAVLWVKNSTKVYKDSVLGFEFKYPKNYAFKEYNSSFTPNAKYLSEVKDTKTPAEKVLKTSLHFGPSVEFGNYQLDFQNRYDKVAKGDCGTPVNNPGCTYPDFHPPGVHVNFFSDLADDRYKQGEKLFKYQGSSSRTNVPIQCAEGALACAAQSTDKDVVLVSTYMKQLDATHYVQVYGTLQYESVAKKMFDSFSLNSN